MNDDDIIIPQKYSRIGYFSSLYLLIPGYYSFINKNYNITFVSVFLYITTNLFWHKIKKNFFKKLDLFAVLLFSFVSAYETFYKMKYFYIYYFISAINVIIFFINKNINYKQIINAENKKDIPDYVYIELVLIHILTLHVAQPLALTYVMLYN